MKKLFLSVFILVLSIAANAQMVDPVHFTSQLNMLSGDEAEIVFSAKIDKGWHLYSTDLGNDGPISATFNINRMDGAKTVGKLTPKGKEISQFDKMFGMKLRFFEGNAKFVQRIKVHKRYVRHRLLSGVRSMQRRDVHAAVASITDKERQDTGSAARSKRGRQSR